MELARAWEHRYSRYGLLLSLIARLVRLAVSSTRDRSVPLGIHPLLGVRFDSSPASRYDETKNRDAKSRMRIQ